MKTIVSFLVGLLLGLGLIVAGMSNPAKVLGFLDLAGAWDPSLALVMGGAVAVGFAGFTVARRRKVSVLGEPMRFSTIRHVDRPLIVGSAVFGIGWGLAGICPGPALTLLGAGAPEGVVFVLAMLAGMALFSALPRRG